MSFGTMENICTGLATSATVHHQECTKGTGLPFVPVPVCYKYSIPTYLHMYNKILAKENFHG